MRKPGWQQPAVPLRTSCPHMGLLLAMIEVSRHPVGHEWVCVCGKTFVVASGNNGRTKTLVRRGVS